MKKSHFNRVDTRALVDVAMGRAPADLVIRNGRWVCVQSGEIIPNTDIAIKDSHIAYVGENAGHTIGKKTKVIDAQGKYLVPGLLDGHMHVESGMVTVTEFVRAVAPRFALSCSEKLLSRVAELSRQSGLVVPPDRLVADLSVGEAQRVEILKALFRETDVLILDEPTAVLTPQEADAGPRRPPYRSPRRTGRGPQRVSKHRRSVDRGGVWVGVAVLVGV